MKNKMTLFILGLLIGNLNIIAQTATPPSVGDGSSGNPYQIATLDNLYWLSQTSADWDKHYIQTADIDATDSKNWDSGQGFSPIGKYPNYFSGNYNGQGHTIDSLFINRPEEYQLGLFGVDSDSEISNVKLTNISFTGDSYVGGIGGEIDGNITNCSVTGEVNGLSYSAGIVGEFYGTATNCFADVNVTGEDQNGGFAGDLQYATVLNCYSTGNVTSYTETGGFVGYLYYSEVSNSYCSGSVSGSQVGGFIGKSSGNCIITNCYTSSPVSSTGVIDGFLAYAESAITINNSFYNTDNYATTTTDAIGITTAEMKTLCTYLDGTNAAWDFMIETTNGTDNIWGLNASENGGYPFLAYQGFEHTESCCGIIDITAPETPTLADITGECSVTPTAPTTTDNCAGTVTGTTATTFPITTQGTTVVTWTFDDGNGNSIDVEQNVIINDITNPTITCVDNQTINLLEGQTTYAVSGTEFDPTATDDNCNVASVINDFNTTATLDAAELPIGTTTIGWTVTDDAGNTEICSFDVLVNAYVGINNLSNNKISIYPNPSRGIVNLEFANNNIQKLTISDITGKKIIKKTEIQQNEIIDLSSFENGIYIISIQTDNEIFTTKIIKE